MLTYDLSERGNTSLYQYLYQCILQDIRKGVIGPGEQLPSKRVLASHLSVGLITVENAYAQLQQEGYIYSIPPRGYFVQSGPSEGIQEASSGEEKEEAEHEYLVDFKANKSGMSRFPASVWAKLMRQVLSEQSPELLKTVPYNGLFVLRKAISDYLRRVRGMQVKPSQIIIGAGTEYLYSRLLQLLGGSAVAMEDPGYKKFGAIADSLKIPWVHIPIDGKGIQTKALAESGAGAVHVSPANHFPTGIVMPRQRRRELLEWAYEERERYIIEDDYDSELRYRGKILPTIYAMDRQQRVIYMNTFSKSLVPSIRISYMVLPDPLMERYRRTLSFYSCTVSSFEQCTLAKFISEGYLERHVNRQKTYYKDKRDKVIAALGRSRLIEIARICEHHTGTHFLLKVRTAMSDEEIREKAEEKYMHLELLSGYFHAPEHGTSGTIVINYASIEPDKIDQAVSTLEKIFEADIEKKD